MSIQIKDLSFSYGQHKVLDGVSFSAEAGSLLAVLGPNGVGKSTLFHCMLGLLTNYKGTITINGEDAKKIGIQEMARQVAYIPQSHSPVFNFSVFEIVLMGTTSQVSAVCNPGHAQSKLANSALERLGIGHLKERGYTKISGGERQLVLIARALAQNAKILVMDEPTSSLDYGNQIRILTHIRDLTAEGYTIIQSTHNPDQTFMFANQVLALSKGRIIKQGKPVDVISEEMIRTLYGVEVEVQSLRGDRARVCLPSSVVNQ
jgi:iron complex transport system ATP-binding protein